MTRFFKKAIFVAMALVMSSSIVFGQNNDSYNNLSDGNQSMSTSVVVKITNPTTSIDKVVDNATIEFRWKEFNAPWTIWKTEPYTSIDQDFIYLLARTSSSTNSPKPTMEFEYKIRAYSGPYLVRSTCGITDVVIGTTTYLNLTTWNRCLGEPLPFEDFPNDED